MLLTRSLTFTFNMPREGGSASRVYPDLSFTFHHERVKPNHIHVSLPDLTLKVLKKFKPVTYHNICEIVVTM